MLRTSRFFSGFLFFVVLALSEISAGPAQAQAARYNWKCYTYLSATTDPLYKMLLDLAEQINRQTKGQIRMTCNLGGSIPIKSGTITQAVSDNVLHFGMADSNSYSGFIPLSGLISLPGLFSSDEELETGFKILKPTLDKLLAEKNVKLLGDIHYPAQVFWSTGVVKSLKDITGMKVRVTTSEQAEFLKRIDAIPVTLGSPEVSSALQSGLVQGAMTASSGGGRLWREYFKSNYRLGPNYVSIMLVVNKATFERLPPDLQGTVSELVAKASADMTKSLHAEEDVLTAEFAKGGMIVTAALPEDEKLIQDRMRSYWADWAKNKGPAAEAALAEVLTALKKK
jgi:TRAP-type C4-dicarboxylate transport system substrate-binding protein